MEIEGRGAQPIVMRENRGLGRLVMGPRSNPRSRRGEQRIMLVMGLPAGHLYWPAGRFHCPTGCFYWPAGGFYWLAGRFYWLAGRLYWPAGRLYWPGDFFSMLVVFYAGWAELG